MPKPISIVVRVFPVQGQPLSCLVGLLMLISFSGYAKPGDILRSDRKILVVVDAAHGGKDLGSKSGGLVEKDIDLKVAFRLSQLGIAHNVQVELTRDGDKNPSIDERVGISIAYHPEYFISVHIGDTDKTIAGYQIEITQNSLLAESKQFAETLVKYLSRPFGVKPADISIKEHGLHVLRKNPAPAVVLELGNIKNPERMQLLIDDSTLDEICNAILNAVVAAHNAK